MSPVEVVIASHPFFQGLEQRYITQLADGAKYVHFGAGEVIFHEGQPANHFFLIDHGRVSLDVAVPGSGVLTIQTIGAGDVLGWSWLFPPYRWHFDANAVEATDAVVFDGAHLRQLIENDHALGYQLMKRFAQVKLQRLQATRLQLLDLMGAPKPTK